RQQAGGRTVLHELVVALIVLPGGLAGGVQRGRGVVERRDRRRGRRVGGRAHGSSIPSVVRSGTGMKIATKTSTTSQNSRRRLRGSGRSSTGGWARSPPDRRPRTLRNRYHTSQNIAALPAIPLPSRQFQRSPISPRTVYMTQAKTLSAIAGSTRWTARA